MANYLNALGNAIARVNLRIAPVVLIAGMVVMTFMPIPVFLDVLLRETSGIWPLIFPEETAYSIPSYLYGVQDMVTLSLLLVTFAGFAWLCVHDDYISVTFVIGRFSSAAQALCRVFSSIVSAAFFLILTANICLQTYNRYVRNEHTEDIGLTLWVFTAIAAAASVIMLLGSLAAMLKNIGAAAEANSAKAALAPVIIAALVIAIPLLYRLGGLNMSMSVMGGVGMLMMLTLLFAGVPIGVAMGGVGLLGLLCLYPNMHSAFNQLGLAPLTVATKYDYTVIPLFILMGELAFRSRLSQDMFTAANMWLGRLPGGLAMAGVAGCAGFAAVCGDSMATAVTMGSVALPEMEKQKYDPAFGCATLAAGGTLGILIPPSMGFIFYAIITEESVGRLFVAGIIPGLLLTAAFMMVVAISAILNPTMAPKGEASTLQQKLQATAGVTPMIVLIIFILGGILGGFFSPNEGGAMGAVGTFIYAVVRKTLSWEAFKSSLRTTIMVSGRLMLIMVGVTALGYFFALTQLPQLLAQTISEMSANKYVILAMIVSIYILLGCLMNVIPMIMLTLPALFPTVQAVGFDPIWFGVITVMLMEMGQITPPVGINVFAMSSVAKSVPMQSIFRRVIPFFLAMVAVMLLLIIFPQIVLWLPNLLFE